jgi:hypothetical protein
VSADCADAWVILAEEAPDAPTALERYEQAVAGGVRAIGPDGFEQMAGEFWGHLETRPYMRARLGLARTLEAVGRGADAVEHYREMLRLNPGDNQGVRYMLVVALLAQHRDDEAGALLDEHADEATALLAYARVLWSFRTGGASAASRAALDAAVRINAHALTYLLDPEKAPVERSPYISFGGRDGGAYVEEELGDLFETTPGALEWLLAEQPRVRRRSPARQRSSSARKKKGRH